MKKKITCIVLILTLLMTMLTGCGDEGRFSGMKKSEIINEYENLESAYNDLTEQLVQTQNSLDALSKDGTVNEAITTIGDGTGRFTFNSTDSKIIFPNSFVYPNAQPIVPDGSITITSGVTVSPSSTWISRINGSALELEQSTNKISGTIKVNSITEQLPVDQLLTDVLQPWFDSVSYSGVTYTDIFVGTTSFGKQAETPIMIDSENAYLICGMVGLGTYSVTYVFVYRGDVDSTKNELVKSIINTISINGNTLLIQN